jgi:hypothetical protein
LEKAKLQAFLKGATKQGTGMVFTAFDGVWPLVGLALALATIVCWITLLGHVTIQLLWVTG